MRQRMRLAGVLRHHAVDHSSTMTDSVALSIADAPLQIIISSVQIFHCGFAQVSMRQDASLFNGRRYLKRWLLGGRKLWYS